MDHESAKQQSSPNTMRLCFVGRFGERGGAYPRGSQLVGEALADRGHEVVFSSRHASRAAHMAGVTRALTARRRPDAVVIDTYSTAALWYARLASRLAARRSIPVVAALHGGGLPSVAAAHPQRLQPHLGRARRVVAPSSFLARSLEALANCPIEIIPNPIDVQAHEGIARRKARARMVWVRAFRDEYRPEDAVRVLAAVRARCTDATLVMVGPDGDGAMGRCEHLIADLGLGDVVRITGLLSKDGVRAELAQADIFLNTTSIDNAPVTLVEAQATGLCIVSTDAGGIPDLVEHEQTALLAPIGDIGNLASHVERVVTDDALAARLSRAGLDAAASYDLGRVVPRWEALLRALVEHAS